MYREHRAETVGIRVMAGDYVIFSVDGTDYPYANSEYGYPTFITRNARPCITPQGPAFFVTESYQLDRDYSYWFEAV